MGKSKPPPAPIGNQWWRLRSKHGRDTLFESPELLWQAALEYFEHTNKRKWTRTDWVGKDAVEVVRENDTPFTLSGLCLYLDCGQSYFRNFKQNLKEKTDERSRGFKSVIARIEDAIYTQKLEGAAAGQFKENIVAMELGLKYRTDITSNDEPIAIGVTVASDAVKKKLDEMK